MFSTAIWLRFLIYSRAAMAMIYNRPLLITLTVIVFVILIGIVLLLRFQPRSISYVIFAGILLSIAVIVKWRFMVSRSLRLYLYEVGVPQQSLR